MKFLKNIALYWIKRAVIFEINQEGDRFQELLRSRIAKEGPGSVDRTIDAAQLRLLMVVETSGPKWSFLVPLRAKIKKAVQRFGDDLQVKINAGVRDHGPAAVDRVFDTAQAALIKSVEAIRL